MDIDFEKLKRDLLDFFCSAMFSGFKMAIVDYSEVEESPETTKEKEELKSLTFTIKEIKDEDSEDTAEEDKMVESNGTSGDIQTGKFSITIYNKKGSLLPKTGGIGTIIFYVLGISLILFAVYLIISKRKKR